MMVVTIRCPNCGKKFQAEDMGDNCICPVCNKFIISISAMMKEQIFSKQQGGKNVKRI